ncbi:MAG: hypothetical protein MJ154_03090 [Candidatus Saccharibacteria bacterium]|nr:hypothetical protein [Candidatus Saccharibacteria bacterium]
MTHKRASHFEKMCRTYGIILMFLIVGAVTIYNINLSSSAVRTSDGVAEIVDCDNIIKKIPAYNTNNNLGSLGVFSTVAFNNIKGGSYKGGFAANNISETIGFGEQNKVSINYAKATSVSPFNGWNSNVATSGSMLVLGSGFTTSANSNWDQWNNHDYNISGSSLPAQNVGSGDMSSPSNFTTNIYKEDSQAFVDLDNLKTIATELNQGLAGLSDANASKGSANSWEAVNISVSGSGLAVLNVSARDGNWDAGYNINNLGNGQTLVINFDMKNYNSTQIAGFNVNHSGNSNVIVNVIDTSKTDKQYTGNITIQNAKAFILAPSANITVNNSEGIVIGKDVKIDNANYRAFFGDFPVEATTKESFGACDTGGETPVGKHKLTVNHYIKGESEPFDKTFADVEDGGSYDAEVVTVDYLTYSGVRNGSAPIHGENVTEDVTVELDYTVNKIQIDIKYVSTEGDEIKTVKSPLLGALDTYTVTPEKFENYKYDHPSAALSQRMKDFGGSITLYFKPWKDPAEVVTEEMTYEKTPYYVESNLSTLGGFHMIAFDRVDANVRAYGNILTNRVDNMSEFSLVHFPLVSYAKVIGDNIKNPKFAPNDQVQTVLVVGKDVDVDQLDNGNRWSINGQKIDSPAVRKDSEHTNLWREKDIKFIDLEQLESDSIAFSQLLGSYDDITTEIDFSDVNNKKIIVGNQEGLNVVNLTYEDFDDSRDLFVEGFDKEKKSTLVINVDMAGFTGDVFNFAGTRLRWEDGVYQEGSSASSANLDEVRLNNTITLNFIDSSSEDGLFHGTAKSSRPMLAFSLMPAGRFIIESSSYAGAIVAKQISGNGNSYMVLFDHAFYQLIPDEPEPEPIPESPKTDDNIMTFVLFGIICSALAALSVTEYLISLRKR